MLNIISIFIIKIIKLFFIKINKYKKRFNFKPKK